MVILRSLLRKFDIGTNKRQSIFYTIAGIGSRQISTKNHPPLRTGQTSGLDSVHIGTIRKILSSWWLHIKLTHSRMSAGYHEWPGVLFIGVWRASACSPGRELCCLDGETGNRACAKKPILVLWMQFSFLRFKLKEEPLTYTGIATQCWKALAFYCDWHAFSLTLWVFFTWFIVMVKNTVLNMSWKTCLRRYTNEILFLLLSLAEFIQLAINISISYMAKKHKKRQRTHQLYIFSNFRDIYLITENNCSKKGTDC